MASIAVSIQVSPALTWRCDKPAYTKTQENLSADVQNWNSWKSSHIPQKRKKKKNLQPEQLRSILSFNNFFSTVLGQGLQLGLG